MDGLESLADVLGGTSLAAVHAEAVALGRLIEQRLGVVGGEGVEEGAQGGRDAVVELVAGGPEGITAGLGELNQPQESIVAGDGLEGDVGVPLILGALAAGADADALVREPVLVQCLGLLRGDDADLVVATTVLAAGVADGVDVKARSCGLAGELAESVNEFLLEVIGEVILLAEEDDTALGNLMSMLAFRLTSSAEVHDLLVMARSLRSSSELGARSNSERSTLTYSRPRAGVTSKLSNCSRAPLSLRASL